MARRHSVGIVTSTSTMSGLILPTARRRVTRSSTIFIQDVVQAGVTKKPVCPQEGGGRLAHMREAAKRVSSVILRSARSARLTQRVLSPLVTLKISMETLILEAQNKRKKNPNESSARQKANWLDWEDIKEFHKKTKETLEHFGLPKEDMDVDEKMMYVNYIILSLYCADEDNPPLRNDYANMRVVDDEEKTDDEHNFLITSKPMRFMLNDYKTVKTYGKAILPVGKVLQPILEEYLTYNDSGYLINDAMGNPISTNVLSQRLIKMFADGVGKRISTQLLRHSYITHHLPPEKRKRKVLAKKMLHSPQMNMEYSLYIE